MAPLDNIEGIIKENTKTIVDALTPIGCALELDKEVVVPAWSGKGAHEAARAAREPGRLTEGTKATSARYLGDFVNVMGTNAVAVAKRITAANTGFYA